MIDDDPGLDIDLDSVPWGLILLIVGLGAYLGLKKDDRLHYDLPVPAAVDTLKIDQLEITKAFGGVRKGQAMYQKDFDDYIFDNTDNFSEKNIILVIFVLLISICPIKHMNHAFLRHAVTFDQFFHCFNRKNITAR